jgi:hypothetical protein
LRTRQAYETWYLRSYRPLVEERFVEAAYGSATEVVQAAVAALEAERCGDVLPLVRPEALRTLRDTHLRWMIESERRASRTPEELQAEQPWLPREVAAYYAEQKHVTQGLPVMRAEWGVSSLTELEALSPAEFFIRYLSASSPAAKLRAALAVSPRPPKDPALAREAIEAAHRRHWVVLGEVPEGTRKAHVLYRELAGDEQYDADSVAGDVRVTTLDYVDGRWWLRIDHTLLDQQGWVFAWAPNDEDSTGSDGTMEQREVRPG